VDFSLFQQWPHPKVHRLQCHRLKRPPLTRLLITVARLCMLLSVVACWCLLLLAFALAMAVALALALAKRK